MTTTSIQAPSRTTLTGKQRAGIVIGGVYALLNLPSAFLPVPEGGADGPPLAILVVCTVLSAVGLVAAVAAWRGSRLAARICAGAITVVTITSLPAFFVDVPMVVKALVAVGVLVTVAAVALMLSGPRRPQV